MFYEFWRFCICLADSRVIWLMCDFVLYDYMGDIVVVYGDVCCC